MAQVAKEEGRGAVSDVGNTYQALLMSDAGWRVPAAHDDFTASEAIPEPAGRERIEQETEPPTSDQSPTME